MVTHTARCEQARLRRAVFERQFPNFCKTCQGRGLFTWSENQAPHASGLVWLEDLSEPCTDCVGSGKCPRCGRSQYFHWYERLAIRVQAWWFQRFIWCNQQVNRRGRRRGIAGDPWSFYNWPEKLAHHASRFCLKAQQYSYRLLYGPEGTPFDQAGYTCRFCGWQDEEDVPAVYECWCDREEMYHYLDVS